MMVASPIISGFGDLSHRAIHIKLDFHIIKFRNGLHERRTARRSGLQIDIAIHTIVLECTNHVMLSKRIINFHLFIDTGIRFLVRNSRIKNFRRGLIIGNGIRGVCARGIVTAGDEGNSRKGKQRIK